MEFWRIEQSICSNDKLKRAFERSQGRALSCGDGGVRAAIPLFLLYLPPYAGVGALCLAAQLCLVRVCCVVVVLPLLLQTAVLLWYSVRCLKRLPVGAFTFFFLLVFCTFFAGFVGWMGIHPTGQCWVTCGNKNCHRAV